jgi:hypothetical protein
MAHSIRSISGALTLPGIQKLHLVKQVTLTKMYGLVSSTGKIISIGKRKQLDSMLRPMQGITGNIEFAVQIIRVHLMFLNLVKKNSYLLVLLFSIIL